MKNVLWLLCCMCTMQVMAQTPYNATPEMLFGDTTRIGLPFAKDPYVIKWNKRYLMYYTIPAHKDTAHPVKGWGIGIAESKDLTHWVKIGEMVPEADYEKKGFCAPSVLVIKKVVHLFYQTYGNGTRDAICHATSTDGIHFTRNATNPIFRPTGKWTCGRAIDAEVVAFNDRYYLFFATRDPAYSIQMQGVAATKNLQTNFNRGEWSLLADSSIMKPELAWEGKCVEAASILVRGKQMFMFYAGNYNNAPQQIGVAKSTDGVQWKRLSVDPFLPVGTKGTWNASESGHPHIFKDDDGKTYLFYQGNNTKGRTWNLSKVEVKWNDVGPYLVK